ncbi:ParB N-terminal domain-containing protein [Kibdelosporangium aridum]|uniref:ParB N-terminal domain-containing protein n=1 Tax=Kibdelosporangium aridum TaxID=2030 RepID=UPI00190EBA16|nr:ParB N-terminal domain-containing protein [Kibdelosporangium aridum]
MLTGDFGGSAAATDGFDQKNFDKLPIRHVPVAALSPGLHLRQAGTNATHVQLLIEAATSTELPPILVQQEGCRVIDGLHRLEAAKQRGDQTIPARFLDCTDSEALVIAMEANTSHGLPLTKNDRLAGATRVLTDHPDWSDRAIASITGLSAKTIASLRTRVATPDNSKRLGRDGRRRPVTACEGRRRAAEYIKNNPNAPLRQVARETDVSLGTVHDVCNRLRRGISPERNGNRTENPVATTEPATITSVPDTGTPLRRKNHTETPPTWAEVATKVAKDPTIRYTTGGKEFLRWMAYHASDPDKWRTFITTLPSHWLSTIAPIADNISKEWSQFAEQLKQAEHKTLGA